MILVRRYHDIIVPAIRVPVGVRGWFKLEAIRPDGRRRPLAEFPNLITTNGANLLGGATNPFTTCCVGTGNATPALTDTALASFLASKSSTLSTTKSAQSSSPYFGTLVIVYQFNAGVATGNIAEVGVGATSTNLFSRALILDGDGSPTTITVLSSEALQVTYTVRRYVPSSDVTGTLNVAGTDYGYTLRAANATTTSWAYPGDTWEEATLVSASIFNGTIGAITASPSGSAATNDSVSTDSYSSGSFERTATATWGINKNVSGGVTAAQFNWGFGTSQGLYQVGFDDAIPKDSSHILTLSVSHSWTINSP